MGIDYLVAEVYGFQILPTLSLNALKNGMQELHLIESIDNIVYLPSTMKIIFSGNVSDYLKRPNIGSIKQGIISLYKSEIPKIPIHEKRELNKILSRLRMKDDTSLSWFLIQYII